MIHKTIHLMIRLDRMTHRMIHLDKMKTNLVSENSYL